jgi:hypothetical protein
VGYSKGIMKNKQKYKSINEMPVRNQFLMDGPIQTKVKGSKKGKSGYSRKDKSWLKPDEDE